MYKYRVRQNNFALWRRPFLHCYISICGLSFPLLSTFLSCQQILKNLYCFAVTTPQFYIKLADTFLLMEHCSIIGFGTVLFHLLERNAGAVCLWYYCTTGKGTLVPCVKQETCGMFPIQSSTIDIGTNKWAYRLWGPHGQGLVGLGAWGGGI